LRTGSLRALRQARAARRDACDIAQSERVAGGDDQSLLAPGKRDQDRVVQSRGLCDGLDIRILIVAVETVQMDGGRGDLPTGEPLLAGEIVLLHRGRMVEASTAAGAPP